MPNPNNTPWDIYVDERKDPGCHALGFLVVPNTASFSHKLFLCRHHPPDRGGHTVETREVHWSRLHRGVVRLVKSWIDTVFQHNGVKFYAYPWPRGDAKEVVILRFVSRLTRKKGLTPPYNIVVIMDYDSEHARMRIQNNVREVGQIARCYHLDSLKNDCIQCCDLVLGALRAISLDPSIRSQFADLDTRWNNGEKLSDSFAKKYVASYLGWRLEQDSHQVYDLVAGESR